MYIVSIVQIGITLHQFANLRVVHWVSLIVIKPICLELIVVVKHCRKFYLIIAIIVNISFTKTLQFYIDTIAHILRLLFGNI